MAPSASLTASLSILAAALLLPVAHAAPRGPTSSQGLGVPIHNADVDASRLIPNSYIVVYNESFADDAITAHQASVMAMVARRNVGKRSLDGRALSTAAHTFQIGSWRAMYLQAEDRTMIEINGADEVKYIEQDARVEHRLTAIEQQAPSGLVRLSHAKTNGTNYVYDRSGGDGITAFVVDTGIMINHTEFEGRATWGTNFVNDVVSCPLPLWQVTPLPNCLW